MDLLEVFVGQLVTQCASELPENRGMFIEATDELSFSIWRD